MLATATAPDKRIVLRHTQGPYAGLHEICGTLSQLGDNVAVKDLPGVLGPITVQPQRAVQASLLRVRTRWILYGEMWKVTKGVFNDFNPAQV